jgi:hypothetical protein
MIRARGVSVARGLDPVCQRLHSVASTCSRKLDNAPETRRLQAAAEPGRGIGRFW